MRGTTRTARAEALASRWHDENLLARARAYERVPPAGALWSLECAARDWQEAVHLALARDAVLLHVGRGEQRVADVARNNAHDAHHHAWDIRRPMCRAWARGRGDPKLGVPVRLLRGSIRYGLRAVIV